MLAFMANVKLILVLGIFITVLSFLYSTSVSISERDEARLLKAVSPPYYPLDLIAFSNALN